MSAGRAFDARGPATENALSVTRSLVRRTTKLHPVRQNEAECRHNDRTVLRGILVRYHAECRTSDAQGAEVELYSARHWQPVEPLMER